MFSALIVGKKERPVRIAPFALLDFDGQGLVIGLAFYDYSGLTFLTFGGGNANPGCSAFKVN